MSSAPGPEPKVEGAKSALPGPPFSCTPLSPETHWVSLWLIPCPPQTQSARIREICGPKPFALDPTMSDVVIKVENLIEPAGFAALTATAKAASAEPPSAKPSPTPPGPRSTVHDPNLQSAVLSRITAPSCSFVSIRGYRSFVSGPLSSRSGERRPPRYEEGRDRPQVLGIQRIP